MFWNGQCGDDMFICLCVEVLKVSGLMLHD